MSQQNAILNATGNLVRARLDVSYARKEVAVWEDMLTNPIEGADGNAVLAGYQRAMSSYLEAVGFLDACIDTGRRVSAQA